MCAPSKISQNTFLYCKIQGVHFPNILNIFLHIKQTLLFSYLLKIWVNVLQVKGPFLDPFFFFPVKQSSTRHETALTILNLLNKQTCKSYVGWFCSFSISHPWSTSLNRVHADHSPLSGIVPTIEHNFCTLIHSLQLLTAISLNFLSPVAQLLQASS